jgi:hypothetical protein
VIIILAYFLHFEKMTQGLCNPNIVCLLILQ